MRSFCGMIPVFFALVLSQLPSSLVAQPLPDIQVPASPIALLGEDVEVQLRFSNVSATSADVGFGPFVDLVIPVNGVDGAAGTQLADGLSFLSASYLGLPVSKVESTFPGDGGGTGCVDHPLAMADVSTPLQVCGTTGDQFLVLVLPFGSFVPGQPFAEVALDLHVSSLADLNVALNVRQRAGFRFGADALDNPCCDPTIVSAASSDSSSWPFTSVTPGLISVRKEYLGPEDETSTGPNFPRQYRIVLDLADGQTVTSVDVEDFMPESLAYLRLVSSTPTANVLDEPSVGTAASAPDNELHVQFSSVVGTTSNNDAEVVLEFFVPRVDAFASDVVAAQSGDDTTAGNEIQVVGDWTPVDGRDPGGSGNVIFNAAGPEHVLSQQSISIQKSVQTAVESGASGTTPGDVLEYTLEVQVSDYFAVSSVVVTDVLSDGQLFDASFQPTLAVTEHGATSSSTLDVSSYTVAADKTPGSPSPNTGQTTVTFNLSSELAVRALDGLLVGGCVPTAGTGGGAPDCGSFDQGATTATIVFRATVAETFSDNFPSGDASVDQGDVLQNSATVASTLHSVADLSATAQTEDDDTSTTLKIAFGTVTKSVYAINGNLGFAQPIEVHPGDTVTYRLQYSMPTSDYENLVISDYLPLPVFSAAEVTQLVSQAGAAIPVAGSLKFGPADTLLALTGSPPSMTVDPVGNSVSLNYGDFDSVASGATQLDVLFTVTVSDEPFADGLPPDQSDASGAGEHKWWGSRSRRCRSVSAASAVASPDQGCGWIR